MNFFKVETRKKELKENNTVLKRIFKDKNDYKDKKENSKEVLEILIGFDEEKQPVYLDEKSFSEIPGRLG